jgi:hypothetical protein
MTLLTKTSPRAIISSMPRVIEIFAEQGVDFRPQAFSILEAVLPLMQDEPVQEQILTLYEQLNRLDGSEGAGHASDLLDRLRELEQREADQYAREFDAWRPLKEGALDAALRHATSLLKK